MTSLLPPGTAQIVRRNMTPEPERELPTDPVAWVRDELSEHVWSKQREIMRSVLTHKRTMVPSAHESGKSHIASRVVAYWVAAHPVGTVRVETSAPSENQVKGILWQNVASAKGKAGLAGRIIGLTGAGPAQWFMGEGELVAQGRKPPERVSPEQAMQLFQGVHAENMLVVLDEATGVPGWLWEAAESLIANEGGRLLAIGNPDDASSTFADYCSRPDLCNVIPISAFDTPNFTGEWVPEHLRAVLVHPSYEADMRARLGDDSPTYISKVLGRFPDVSDDAVVSPRLVRLAQERDLPGSGRGEYGLDIARFGTDRSVLMRNRDGVLRKVREWRKQDTRSTRLAVQALVTQGVPIVVDADGLGGAVADELKGAGYPVIEFSVAGKVSRPRDFFDRRSEMWWAMREALEAGDVDLDPADDDLAAQLQMPKWTQDNRGRIRVESKDDLRKRGKPSPDHADAAIMALFGNRGRMMDDGKYVQPGAPRRNGRGRTEMADIVTAEF